MMALTMGTGPFGGQPSGRFNVEPPARPLLFWEPFPKRFRVVAGRKTIADSRNVVALHETGQMMRLCVPWSDVRSEFLVAGPISDGGLAGAIRSWGINTGGGTRAAGAQSFAAPPQDAASLQEHVFFELAKIDAWYLEEDLGYGASARSLPPC